MSALAMLDPSLLAEPRAAAQRATAPGNNAPAARKAAEEFEAFFIAQTMESMFAGIDTDGPFGGGNAERVFRSVLTQEYGKEMAKNGGVGIADQVYAEILKTQEVK